jgi:hypothetical protein
MKKLLRILVVAVAVLLAAVLIAWFMIDSIVKTGVEKGATYALEVPTTVGSVNLSLIHGQFMMNKLMIANPEGFKSPYLMDSGKFDIQTDPGTLFTDSILLKKFELDGLDVNIEQAAGGSNVNKIMDNLKRFQGSGEPAKKEEPAEKKSGKKVRVDKVTIRNVAAHFYLLTGQPITVNVPEIELTGVTSDDSNGVVVGELVSRLIPAILAGVAKQAQGVVPADVLNDMNSQIAGLKAAGAKATEAAAAAVKEAPKNVTNTIGNLLGGEKKQEPAK